MSAELRNLLATGLAEVLSEWSQSNTDAVLFGEPLRNDNGLLGGDKRIPATPKDDTQMENEK